VPGSFHVNINNLFFIENNYFLKPEKFSENSGITLHFYKSNVWILIAASAFNMLLYVVLAEIFEKKKSGLTQIHTLKGKRLKKKKKSFFLEGGQYWGLNSELHTSLEGTLPLAPLYQP
jgi:hypothetical protein